MNLQLFVYELYQRDGRYKQKQRHLEYESTTFCLWIIPTWREVQAIPELLSIWTCSFVSGYTCTLKKSVIFAGVAFRTWNVLCMLKITNMVMERNFQVTFDDFHADEVYTTIHCAQKHIAK